MEGRGWYGLRRIAADLAESAATDDSVKDRLAAGPLSGENQCPKGSQNGFEEKVAGTRSDSGDWNCLELLDFHRAGDGTRTHDVQLGKETEKLGSAIRANSRRKKHPRCAAAAWIPDGSAYWCPRDEIRGSLGARLPSSRGSAWRSNGTLGFRIERDCSQRLHEAAPVT